MSFLRTLTPHLLNWKKSPHRKPLILRGARQVGKTTLVLQFAETYAHHVALNLELQKDLRFFKDYTDVTTITEAILLAHNIPPAEKNNTLLFIDEIQESPEAIGMLRYFYEKEPELHVIAAGSLLEHAMRLVKSFPVGRVQRLHLFPLNFPEFLSALGLNAALKELETLPVRPVAHKLLLDHFNTFVIVGGMPEVVQEYASTNSIAALTPIYEDLWETYKSDVEKYASNDTEHRIIKHIMSTAHLEVDARIKFQNFGNSNYRSREVGEAFKSLDDAKIIQLIYPTTDTEVPLRIDLKKSPRLLFLDTGLLNSELHIQGDLLAMEDLNDAYRGAIIPHMLMQELISNNSSKAIKPVFWVREKKQSNAEVDIVVQYQNRIIPIEVKSGKEGKLKSLHQFMNATNHPYAVRMYAGEFSIESHTTREGKDYLLMNLPYYLGTQLEAYLAYFIAHHPQA